MGSGCFCNCRIAEHQGLFHLYENCKLIDKPMVNHGNLMNLVIAYTTTKCFCDDPDTTIIHYFKLCNQLVVGKFGKIIGL